MIAGAVTKATVAARCLNLYDWHGSVVAVFHAVILLRAGFSASLYQFGVPAAAAAVLGVSLSTQNASQFCVLNEALRHRGECCSRSSTGDCDVVVSVACVCISACVSIQVEHPHITFQLTCIPCSIPFQAHPWQLTQLALCVQNYVLASICFDNSIGILSCNTIRQNRIPILNGQARPSAVPHTDGWFLVNKPHNGQLYVGFDKCWIGNVVRAASISPSALTSGSTGD